MAKRARLPDNVIPMPGMNGVSKRGFRDFYLAQARDALRNAIGINNMIRFSDSADLEELEQLIKKINKRYPESRPVLEYDRLSWKQPKWVKRKVDKD